MFPIQCRSLTWEAPSRSWKLQTPSRATSSKVRRISARVPANPLILYPATRMLPRPRVAMVQAAAALVDHVLPRAALLDVFLDPEPAVDPEHPAVRHGRLLVRGVRGQPRRKLLHLRPGRHRLRLRRIRHRHLREHLLPTRRRHRVHVHGHRRALPRPGESRCCCCVPKARGGDPSRHMPLPFPLSPPRGPRPHAMCTDADLFFPRPAYSPLSEVGVGSFRTTAPPPIGIQAPSHSAFV